MAGRAGYGGSEMTVLLQNDGGGFSAETLESLLSSSGSSHAAFSGSRSMLNFGGVRGSSINQHFYPSGEVEEAVHDDLDEGLHQSEKKRRLTANQVQFLEKSFEVENKLERERKIKLARDLCLQPRQVAIWFQNRRARWKTKQLERDYRTLKSSFDALKADYDILLKEEEKLNAEVVHLTDKLIVKEKCNAIPEPSELDKPCHDFSSNRRKSSSTDSAISDSESPPHHNDGARTGSSNAFEPDQSDVSHVEDEEVRGFHQFLKLDDHSGRFDFPVEEHAFWFWP